MRSLKTAAFFPERRVLFHEVVDICLTGLKLFHLRPEFADHAGLPGQLLFHLERSLRRIGLDVLRLYSRRMIGAVVLPEVPQNVRGCPRTDTSRPLP